MAWTSCRRAHAARTSFASTPDAAATSTLDGARPRSTNRRYVTLRTLRSPSFTRDNLTTNHHSRRAGRDALATVAGTNGGRLPEPVVKSEQPAGDLSDASLEVGLGPSDPSRRAWVLDAIACIDADARRSADTHLVTFPLPPDWGIDLYLKDE